MTTDLYALFDKDKDKDKNYIFDDQLRVNPYLIFDCIHDIQRLKKFVLSGYCRINCASYSANTALHIAVQTSTLEYVSALILAGANVNAVNNDNLTPLDCCKSSYTHIKKLLIYYGAISYTSFLLKQEVFEERNKYNYKVLRRMLDIKYNDDTILYILSFL